MGFLFDGWQMTYEAYSDGRVFWGQLYRGKGFDVINGVPLKCINFKKSSVSKEIFVESFESAPWPVTGSTVPYWREMRDCMEMGVKLKTRKQLNANTTELAFSYNASLGCISFSQRLPIALTNGEWDVKEEYPVESSSEYLAEVLINKLTEFYTHFEKGIRSFNPV